MKASEISLLGRLQKLAKEALDRFAMSHQIFSGLDIVLDAKNKNLRFSLIPIADK